MCSGKGTKVGGDGRRRPRTGRHYYDRVERAGGRGGGRSTGAGDMVGEERGRGHRTRSTDPY